RAGRRDFPGKAVIQTYVPDHPLLALAAKQDYPAFYETEIKARRAMQYPPFSDVCQCGFVGPREEEVRAGAFAFLEMLKEAATAGESGGAGQDKATTVKEKAAQEKAAAEKTRDNTTAAPDKAASVPMTVLGVTPASVSRIAGKYRYKIMIKTRNSAALRALLNNVWARWLRDRRDVSLVLDIQPAALW
ncbi:MAG: hypothetical protein FWF49_05135, partial [Oscillospiraceae bacterium]|nr:hypothetical protein [Oscillospiraceae bacterium]